MEKPTIEQIKKHFENAKEVICLCSNEVYTISIIKNSYSPNGSLWGRTYDWTGIKLYDPSQGYAEIISYHETKEEVQSKQTPEQVADYFKNVSSVKCIYSGFNQNIENVDQFISEGSFDDYCVWGYEDGYKIVLLYSKRKGYAETTSFIKHTEEKKNINEINVIFDEVKENETDGALRYNTGKLKWSLVDFDSLEDMVKVLNFGAEKYEPNNWKKGLNTKEISDSLMRHLFAFLRGEDIDKESGLPHTGHIMCNAMFLSYMFRFSPDFDKRDIDENKKNNLKQQ